MWERPAEVLLEQPAPALKKTQKRTEREGLASQDKQTEDETRAGTYERSLLLSEEGGGRRGAGWRGGVRRGSTSVK